MAILIIVYYLITYANNAIQNVWLVFSKIIIVYNVKTNQTYYSIIIAMIIAPRNIFIIQYY